MYQLVLAYALTIYSLIIYYFFIKVKTVLSLLIQQNIVQFDQNKKNIIEYYLLIDSVLWRLQYPKYIYVAKSLYGDAAELLVENVLQKGQVLMSSSVETITTRLNEALETSGTHICVLP